MTPVEPSPSRKSILLIEDDTELTLLMTDYFGQHGFDVEAVHDGRTGLARALEGAFDLILLDVMLPVLDGFELLRQLRKRIATPVIMLTARTSQTTASRASTPAPTIICPSPSAPRNFSPAYRAMLRRTGHTDTAPPQIIEAGDLRLNPATREVWRCRTKLVEVTSIEFDILEVLARSAGRTVTRDELTAVLYQRRATPYERSLDVHISHLRKKLGTR